MTTAPAYQGPPCFARRARGHIVEQNGADAPTIGFDTEGSHDRLGRTKGAYFHDYTTVDSAFAVEHGEVELECVDRILSIILDDERQSAVILLPRCRRVELNMDSRVGSGDRRNTNKHSANSGTRTRRLGRLTPRVDSRCPRIVATAPSPT